ncbi:Proton-dependent oligopeptide transporter family [Corchorus olitorius]|uniref:Proton-dependent oligopeptide transporter family n=1 Tax=Corchorus olitorius TaxID=93759 RepID=A0A1R3I8D3_9ROSI|nr:Proton-dependent oligopeptide transporter family [Corchorus olitorius]
MAISNLSAAESETPLLDDTVDGCLDYKGRPVRRSNSGGWSSAAFIIAVEITERLAYYGISSNLISYLTEPLAQSTTTAAAQVTPGLAPPLFSHSSELSLPILFLADTAPSFLLPLFTFCVSRNNLLWTDLQGLGLLTLSAALPSNSNFGGQNADYVTLSSAPQYQMIQFFSSLYLVAFALGGHKPCVQAFGADQFDPQDPEECKAKSSFFNWWYFGMCGGNLLTMWILNYIQDNMSWVLGFGIPCIVMAVGLVILVLGTTTYRFSVKGDQESPFVRIGRVFLLAVSNRKTPSSAIAAEEEAQGTLPTESSKQFKFLNKALLAPDGSKESGKVGSIREVEEAKAFIRLAPIWATCLFYAIVFAQTSTFFTKQGATMDRSVTTGFELPAAALQSFITLSICLFMPIYDRNFVPLTRALTGKPAGITMLQRIGIGLFLSLTLMVVAALVEMQRLKTAQEYGLVDKPNVTVPMSVPNEIRSIGLALYLSIFGVGSFLSRFLISGIENATGGDGRDSWFANNLNRAHID